MYELSLDDFKKNIRVNFKNIPKGVNRFSAVSIDSRTINKGEVFWAIKGENFDGNQFVQQAIDTGALFAVVDNKFKVGNLPVVVVSDTLDALQKLANVHRNKFNIPIIAVTGSNGKTTIKEMIAHILQSGKRVLKTEGNLNNHIGCPLTVLKLKREHQVLIVELGSNHPGEISVLTKISEPTHALISNIGEAHLEFFKNKEAVFKEKTSLFDSMNPKTRLYVNMNDLFLKKYQPVNQQKTISYAFNGTTDIKGDCLKVGSNGCADFRLNGKTVIQLQVPGIHNAYNALAAAAVALDLGYREDEIKQALDSYQAYDKRMQIMNIDGITMINDCYNASPDSMKAAINTVRHIPVKGAAYLVLGDMFELGEETVEFHKEIIREAIGINPQAVFLLGEIMKKAAEGFTEGNIRYFPGNEKAAIYLKKILQPEDLVLIKGSRGMKMEEIIELIKKVKNVS